MRVASGWAMGCCNHELDSISPPPRVQPMRLTQGCLAAPADTTRQRHCCPAAASLGAAGRRRITHPIFQDSFARCFCQLSAYVILGKARTYPACRKLNYRYKKAPADAFSHSTSDLTACFAMISMRTFDLGLGFGHICARLGPAIVTVSRAMIGVRFLVDPDFAGAATCSRCRQGSRGALATLLGLLLRLCLRIGRSDRTCKRLHPLVP